MHSARSHLSSRVWPCTMLWWQHPGHDAMVSLGEMAGTQGQAILHQLGFLPSGYVKIAIENDHL